MGLDSFSYTENFQTHISGALPFMCPYEYLRDNPSYFYSLYLNTMDTFNSLFAEKSNQEYFKDFYKYGYTFDYNQATKFWENFEIRPGVAKDFFLNETIEDIREIVELCKKNKIELIIFINPMHHLTLRASIKEKSYFEFLRRLAEITDFYNFSCFNEITLSNENYIDTSHYRAEIGDMIINVICNGAPVKNSFGKKINNGNVEELIEELRAEV